MESHELMGGKLQVYRGGDNSRFWQCSASIGGKQRRASTRQETFLLAKKVAEDWYLQLCGKDAAGLLTTEKTFDQAADKFLEEYIPLTEGQRSPKWAESHEARLRLHLRPFFGSMGLLKIDEAAVQDYRVHRMKTGTVKRFGNAARPAKAETPKPGKEGKPNKAKNGQAQNTAKEAKPTPPSRSSMHDEIGTLRMVLKTALRRK